MKQSLFHFTTLQPFEKLKIKKTKKLFFFKQHTLNSLGKNIRNPQPEIHKKYLLNKTY